MNNHFNNEHYSHTALQVCCSQWTDGIGAPPIRARRGFNTRLAVPELAYALADSVAQYSSTLHARDRWTACWMSRSTPAR